LLELVVEASILSESKLKPLMKEADELIAILTASSQTAKRSLERPTISNQKSKIKNSK